MTNEKLCAKRSFVTHGVIISGQRDYRSASVNSQSFNA